MQGKFIAVAYTLPAITWDGFRRLGFALKSVNQTSSRLLFYSYRTHLRKTKKTLFKSVLNIWGIRLLMAFSLQGSVAVHPYVFLSIRCGATCFCRCSCFQAVLQTPPPLPTPVLIPDSQDVWSEDVFKKFYRTS